MLLTITLIGVAIVALAALEIWLFWSVGERDDRRRRRERLHAQASQADATGEDLPSSPPGSRVEAARLARQGRRRRGRCHA